MLVLAFLTQLSAATAGTEAFSGVWLLDEAASDPIPLPEPGPPPTSGGERSQGQRPSGGGGGRGGGGGGGGGRGGGGGMGGPPGGQEGPSDNKMAEIQALRWMVESGKRITLSGSDDDLSIAWFGGQPVSVSVRLRGHKRPADLLGAPGTERVLVKARWGAGELEVSRDHDGAVFTEHILVPEADRMVVVLELEPPGSGEPLWFRREYTRQ